MVANNYKWTILAKLLNSSISVNDRIITDACSLAQSESETYGNKEVLHISRTQRTGPSPSHAVKCHIQNPQNRFYSTQSILNHHLLAQQRWKEFGVCYKSHLKITTEKILFVLGLRFTSQLIGSGLSRVSWGFFWGFMANQHL